jgi:REP element-mobilizing transposase RayT
MSNIIRSRVPGASIFFAVNLANRESDLSMREIETLRTAVKQTRAERPFPIDAWGMIKDHMHCLWTLPDGKAEYSVRWSAIKVRVSKAVRQSQNTDTLGQTLVYATTKAKSGPGSAAFWTITPAMPASSAPMSNIAG